MSDDLLAARARLAHVRAKIKELKASGKALTTRKQQHRAAVAYLLKATAAAIRPPQ